LCILDFRAAKCQWVGSWFIYYIRKIVGTVISSYTV
jgi:hypothetical protein